jgi:hypothetical protein
LPIFYNTNLGKKSPTSIKFPLLLSENNTVNCNVNCDDNNNNNNKNNNKNHSIKKSETFSSSANEILMNKFGKNYIYFKFQLMKVSLSHLKLNKYCLPPLNRGEILSSKTSPIPPCNCPIGTKPERNMYVEQQLVKSWDVNYHLKQFENAMYKLTMTKEILCNYSKLIEIREELCYKIKLANLKTD